MYSDRLLRLNTIAERDGSCVIYCMSRDQRVRDNFALLAAQEHALKFGLPLVVLFNLLPHTGVRSREHYQFMLDGLREGAEQLASLNIHFVLTYGSAVERICHAAKSLSPAHIYFDFGPLRGPRAAQKRIAAESDVPCTVVDTHNIIPAWVVSTKREFAAHTMRHKIVKHLTTYLIEPPEMQIHPYSLSSAPDSLSSDDAQRYIDRVPTCGIDLAAQPGEHAAHAHLQKFITTQLDTYAIHRNNIAIDNQSGLSPYLHYGQIASLRVALEVLAAADEDPLLYHTSTLAQPGTAPSISDGMNTLFEEMIVRKELLDNFCLHATSYTSLDSADAWARDTLVAHQNDPREHIYTQEELVASRTHDPAWNAAQNQLRRTGKLHGYMRMYWAKKILEWTPDADTAVQRAIYLNDSYSIDGGDPNGYAGILWSIAGVHDRPWPERPIFGKIRYMNSAGLKRKFNIDAYIATYG